jgi:hypothetical protein
VDELTAAYYEVSLRLRYLESKGDTFQDLFSTVMEMRYPGDFVRVRPWGKFGDRKNDGYLASKRQLFQCYAPREMDMATCKAKVNEDFAGALPFWKDHFDDWVFAHNDIDGLAAEVLKLLLDLSAAHAPVKASHWGFNELRQEFKQLSSADLMNLLGPAPQRRDVVDLRLEDVKRLLEHIALQPEPMTVDVRQVPADKLEYNQLSQASGTLLKAGMTRSEIVKKYLRGIADQTRFDRTAASFRLRYQELKQQELSPDDIFVGLQMFVSGHGVASPRIKLRLSQFLLFSSKPVRFSRGRRNLRVHFHDPSNQRFGTRSRAFVRRCGNSAST